MTDESQTVPADDTALRLCSGAAPDPDRPVAVQQGNLMATSFHPELTNDYRFHSYFLELAGRNGKSVGSQNGAS